MKFKSFLHQRHLYSLVMNKNRTIAVSGTPGTGKSSFAKRLSEKLDCKLVDLNEIIEKAKIYETDPDGTKIVDPQDLREAFEEVVGKEEVDRVVDGLLSYLLSSDQVTEVVVLRTKPGVLKIRLEEREYPDEKIRENLEAEALGTVLGETIQKHGFENAYEIDTTERGVDEAVDLFLSALKEEKSLAPGSVDWMEDYF